MKAKLPLGKKLEPMIKLKKKAEDWNSWYVWERVDGCWIKHRLDNYG